MITIDNLVQTALDEVPAFKTEYERLIGIDEIDKNSDGHIVFGYAFTPKLVEAIQNGEKEVYENMLQFTEKMAGAEDGRVAEICDYAIMEVLNDEFSREELWDLIGEESKKSYEAVKQYMY